MPPSTPDSLRRNTNSIAGGHAVGRYGMCAVLMHGLVTSSVATIFVCFAHDPNAFKDSHPSLYAELLEAWSAMHGPIMAACGYASRRSHPQQSQQPPPMAEQQARWGPPSRSIGEGGTQPPPSASSMGTESAFFDSNRDDPAGAEL